ncbi:MAG: hypothetical protein WBA09_01940, partial [Candidatus Acidiferrum sp.]
RRAHDKHGDQHNRQNDQRDKKSNWAEHATSLNPHLVVRHIDPSPAGDSRQHLLITDDWF